MIWGIAIVADSAQFSASIAEIADRHRVGTMLTLRTALGFTLTLLTIHVMPLAIATLVWRHAFVPLALGPAIASSRRRACARIRVRYFLPAVAGNGLGRAPAEGGTFRPVAGPVRSA